MGQHIVAIDMSPRAARLAIIDASLRRRELLDLRTVALEDGLTAEQRWGVVRAALPERLDAVVIGVEARAASTRLLSFPFNDVRKVDAAVEFELEGQIPYGLDEVARTHTLVERGSATCEVLAAITPRLPLQASLGAMATAGLEPRAAVLPAVGLAQLVPADAPGRVAILSMGARDSHFVVAGPGLRFARTLRAGGDDVDRVLAARYQVSLADAQTAKHTEARLLPASAEAPADARRLSDAVIEGLTPLVSHLLASLKALPQDEVPATMLLTGGLSRLPGLPEFLSARLGLSVSLLDVRAALDMPGGPPAVGPEYAMVLGMALALFMHGRDIPLNFRRGELAYHGDIRLYRGQLTRIAVGLAAVFTLAIFGSVVRYSVLRAQEKELDKGFCTATQQIVGRPICDSATALATLRQTPGAEGTTIPSYSAGALLEMLSKLVPTEVDVQFEELDVHADALPGQPDRITGKGEAASFEAIEQLVAALKKDVCVVDAEPSKQRKAQGSNRVEFAIGVKVTCPVGVPPGTKQQAVAQVPGSPAPAAP